MTFSDLNSLDRQILWHLDFNARISVTELAELVKASKQVVSYHILKLKKEGFIARSASILDRTRLGYLTYRVYFRYRGIDPKREKYVLQYFIKHPRAHWVASLAGAWDLEIVFSEKNSFRFNELLKKIRFDLGDYFDKYNVSVSTVNYYYTRDYLLGNGKRKSIKPVAYYGLDPSTTDWDDLDRKILIEVASDCDRSNEELARKLKVTAHTIKSRLTILEEKQIIQCYRAFVGLEKLERHYFKSMMQLTSLAPEKEAQLYEMCTKDVAIVCITEVLGDWQLEVEGEMEQQQELVELMRKVKYEFPDSFLDYDIVEVTAQHKYNYFPEFKATQQASR